MVDGALAASKFGITMDYRTPADTAVTVVPIGFTSLGVNPVQFQIIDVTGKGSRRVVALTANGREFL